MVPKRLKLNQGRLGGKLGAISKNEFPPMPVFEEKFAYELTQPRLKDIYQKIAYAASTDESRAILNGALMSFKE